MRHGCAVSLFALTLSAALAAAQTPKPSHCPPCDDPCACICDCLCPCDDPWDPSQLWVSAEYLLWWFKDSPLPIPLVTTTADPSAFPLAAINQSTTTVLLGNQDIDTHTRSGARFLGGLWLDNGHRFGVEGGYLFIASRTTQLGVATNGQPGSPVLAVPFFDADTNGEHSFVRGFPTITAGSAQLTLTSRMQSAELNGVANMPSYAGVRLVLLGGFRFADLKEHLSFGTTSLGVMTTLPPAGNNGLVFDTQDRFNTHNYFYGGQLGARWEYRLGKWFVNGSAKVALGDMFEITSRFADYTTNVFNNPAGGPAKSTPGFGAFVQQSNYGSAHRHAFAVVPELGVNVGYQITSIARLFVGYDFLYMSDVLRPGRQIDRTINFSQTVDSIAGGRPFVPGTRPNRDLTSSDFWAQGLNFGVELRY